MATQTTYYQLYKPTVQGDADTWGTLLNYNADTTDQALKALSVRIDTNQNSIASVTNSNDTLYGTINTVSAQVSAIQIDQTDQDSEISDLDNRLSSAETKIVQLQGASTSSLSLGVGSVTSEYLANQSVTTVKIADSAVGSSQLKVDSVTGRELANASVDSRHIIANAVLSSHIAPDQVTGTQIASSALSAHHVSSSYVLVPKPAANETDRVLYNDDNYGLIWRRQNKVHEVANYNYLFLNTEDIEPGDLLVLLNGGSAGGGGTNDYPTQINSEPTPATLDATSVFMAKTGGPDRPSDYTIIYTGNNGVQSVSSTNQQATFNLADGTSYNVTLPQFNMNELTEIDSNALAANDYIVVYDRTGSVQRKVQLQAAGIKMDWGATVVQGGTGGTTTTLQNQLGIVLGFEVNTETGDLIMNSTGGFNNSTAYLDTNGNFILVG